jgi:hypothetical protein
MTLAAQADWKEIDDRGRQVSCATNTVRLNLRSVFLLSGGQDRPEQTTLDRTERSGSVTFLGQERPEVDAFEKEYAAFLALLPRLLPDYGGQFVAIHKGSVEDSGDRRDELVKRFFAKFGDVPVYIGYVGRAPVAYQLTPFRI